MNPLQILSNTNTEGVNEANDGFIKSGSSNDYFLLGGGSHTLVSNFATYDNIASSYYTKTQLQTSGQAQVNWGNLTNVPGTFPATAHNHDDRYYTEAESDTKVKTAIDNIQIGGRNYLKRNTIINFYDGAEDWGRTETGFSAYGVAANTGTVRIEGVIDSNGYWTVSFEHQIDYPGYSLKVDICDQGTQYLLNPTNEWIKHIVTVNVTDVSSVYNFVDISGLTAQEHRFRNVKIEKGTKATDWTAAPEDVYVDIANNQLFNNNTFLKKSDNIVSIHGASFMGVGSSSGTKIKLPQLVSSYNMMMFTIRVYQSYTYYDIVFSGFLDGTIGNWYIPQAELSVGNTPIRVKMGRDTDDRAYVWIDGGSYTNLAVLDIITGYVGGNSSSGWNIIATDDTPNIVLDQIIYPNIKTNHVVNAITSTNITNWNTAVGWGNHSGLYLPLSGGTINTGGITISGFTNPEASEYGGFRNTGTNLVLTGNSEGKSGIFFKSTINHPSDYGFIQFHSTGMDADGTTPVSGETNKLIIGVSNDPGDQIVLQVPGTNDLKVSTTNSTSGSTLPTYTIWHQGNDGAGSGLDADLIDGIDSTRINYGDNSSGTINGYDGTPSDWLPIKSGFYRPNDKNGYGALAIWVAHPQSEGGQYSAGITFSYGGTEAWLTGRDGNNANTGQRRIWTSGDFADSKIAEWNTAYSWGSHAGLYSPINHSHTFASITSKPTTIAGYGITDAIKINNSGELNNHSGVGVGYNATTNNSTWFDYNWAGTGLPGSVINFSGLDGRYATEIFSDYSSGHYIGFRTRNGDSNTWNPARQIWHSGNDGSGSGLDADLWDGFHFPQKGNWNSDNRGYMVAGTGIGWRNYGNNHIVIDMSNGSTPDGTSKSNVNADVPWSASYPTLMGYNGVNTYGVRVDSSRVADYASNSDNLGGVAASNYVTTNTTQTITGAKTFNSIINFSNNVGGIQGAIGDNDYWRIIGSNTASNAGYLEIATADDGTEPIYVRQYTGVFGSITRTAKLLDESGNTSFPGDISGSRFKWFGSTNNETGLVTEQSAFNNIGANYGYGISTNAVGGLDIMANQQSQPIRFWSGGTNTSEGKILSATFLGTSATFAGDINAPRIRLRDDSIEHIGAGSALNISYSSGDGSRNNTIIYDGQYNTITAFNGTTHEVNFYGDITARGKAFINLSGNHGLSPSVSLAIGDNDTGFHWEGDGSISYISNGTKKFDLNNVWHTGNFNPGNYLTTNTIQNITASKIFDNGLEFRSNVYGKYSNGANALRFEIQESSDRADIYLQAKTGGAVIRLSALGTEPVFKLLNSNGEIMGNGIASGSPFIHMPLPTARFTLRRFGDYLMQYAFVIGGDGIFEGNLVVTNNITAAAFYESSVRELKENIQPFTQSGLELVEKLDIVTFDRKDKTAVNKIGIIADDSPNEFLSEELDAVDLYKTVFIQAKAIQELKSEIDELKELVKQLLK